jgi:hypothetical protein
MMMKKRGIGKTGKKRKNKKGQTMSLPFTMIFAIIMVAIVIFVGFYVIRMFLDQATQVELNTLPREIQDAVVQAWQSSETERTITLDCSNKIEMICFVDLSENPGGASSTYYNELENFDDEANFFYYPLMKAEKYNSFSNHKIMCGTKECLKVEKFKNPLCIQVIGGKITFTLVKEAGDPYVIVKS